MQIETKLVDNRGAKKYTFRAFGQEIGSATMEGKTYTVYSFGGIIEVHKEGLSMCHVEFNLGSVIAEAAAKLDKA